MSKNKTSLNKLRDEKKALTKDLTLLLNEKISKEEKIKEYKYCQLQLKILKEMNIDVEHDLVMLHQFVYYSAKHTEQDVQNKYNFTDEEMLIFQPMIKYFVNKISQVWNKKFGNIDYISLGYKTIEVTSKDRPWNNEDMDRFLSSQENEDMMAKFEVVNSLTTFGSFKFYFLIPDKWHGERDPFNLKDYYAKKKKGLIA